MCGRTALFKIAGVDFKKYNISPTNVQPIVVHHKNSTTFTCITENTDKVLPNSSVVLMRWGFPFSNLIINIRDDSDSFQSLRDTKRCIVPANCFYEWHHDGKKQAYCICSDSLFYFAGVYQKIKDEWYYVIMTTDITPQLSFLHHRMPVIFTKDEAQEWLRPDRTFEQLKHMIKSKEDGYKVYPVSSFVNKGQNDGPECVEPVKIAKQMAFSFTPKKRKIGTSLEHIDNAGGKPKDGLDIGVVGSPPLDDKKETLVQESKIKEKGVPEIESEDKLVKVEKESVTPRKRIKAPTPSKSPGQRSIKNYFSPKTCK